MANGDQASMQPNGGWYTNEPPDLKPATREILEKYSKIPPDQVIPHIQAIRDKGWAIHNYPCIGQWRFLDLAIGSHKLYPEILKRMLSGQQTYLDLGCAFAQDIRRLVADGVDSSKCYGSDLHLDFVELGYDLFKDRDTLKSRFIAADILDEKSALKELDGSIDIIGASSFFHLFDWQGQKMVALRVAKLLKPQAGSLLVGRQVGNEQAGEHKRGSGEGSMFRHNSESWRKMWVEVGEELGMRFDVQGELLPVPGLEALMLHFSVRRQ